jgi:pimeloyl-ACP methyl ester carboxylesterase
MATIKPFKIDVKQDVLDDLKARLQNTIMPSEVKDGGWAYGATNEYVQDMIDTLLHKYDWRKHEEAINKYPQFITNIDGQDIHFLHVESAEANATPLMLVHGWPGSFVEFLNVIEPLTNPVKHGGKAENAFHVVIPSIPGFGFSGPTTDAGWGTARVAAALNTLMQELGYTKYGVQGGDAGAMIAPEMGRLAPENVIGIHLNAATIGFVPFGPIDEAEIAKMTDNEKVRLQRIQQFMQDRAAFNAIQSSRPQTLAYGISDSPAGLIAWISDLFTEYGEKVGMIKKEDFLTNFMVYWVTGTAASSIRFYYEGAHDPSAWAPKANSGVPTGVAVFQQADVALRSVGEQANTIVRWTEYEKGNHFAAMEVPETIIKDVREFFGEL